MYLVTWTVLGKRNALITADRSAHEHAKDIAGFEGVTDVGVQEFDSIDLSRVGVPAEEHDILMAAKNAQIAALEARPRVFAVAFVTNEHDELLLIRNKKRCAPFGSSSRGGWELPGGHVEPNEDPHTAAMRETEEEAGVVPSLEHLSFAVLPGARGVSIMYRGRANGVLRPGDDAEDAAWCPREWLATTELSDIPSRHLVLKWAEGPDPDEGEEVACEAKAARARFFRASRDSEKAWQEVVRPYVQERRADHARLFALEDAARGNAAPCPSVLPVDTVATDYTSTQLATAVDEAHDALHEAEAALNGSATAWGTTSIRGRIAVAHEALHRVGAGQPRADVPPSGHVSADRSRVEP